jgi:hypothetical protein
MSFSLCEMAVPKVQKIATYWIATLLKASTCFPIFLSTQAHFHLCLKNVLFQLPSLCSIHTQNQTTCLLLQVFLDVAKTHTMSLAMTMSMAL